MRNCIPIKILKNFTVLLRDMVLSTYEVTLPGTLSYAAQPKRKDIKKEIARGPERKTHEIMKEFEESIAEMEDKFKKRLGGITELWPEIPRI